MSILSEIAHEFNVPLHFIGTDFQKNVWQVLQQIPYGEPRSYGQQAMILVTPRLSEQLPVV